MSLWPSPQQEFIARRKYEDSLYGFRCDSQHIYICAVPDGINIPNLLAELQAICPVSATGNVLSISPASRDHISALINTVLKLLSIGLKEAIQGAVATYDHPEFWNVQTQYTTGTMREVVLSGPHLTLQNRVCVRYPLFYRTAFGPLLYNACQSDILLWCRIKDLAQPLTPGVDLPASIVDPRFVYWKPLQEHVAARVHPQRLAMLTEALDDDLAKEFRSIY